MPDVRENLIAETEALIREEGYGAATARNIADRVGMKHQVIFYYFGSLDNLLIAVYRKVAGIHCSRLVSALASPSPLSSLWEAIRDPEIVRFTLEFIALSNHNKKVRAEIATSAEDIRKLECEGITRHLRERGIDPRLSPHTISILSNAVARFLAQESGLGIHLGHQEIERLIADSFRSFEATGDTTAEMQPLVRAMGGKRHSP
jgi:AcrR family transcriptional regulator